MKVAKEGIEYVKNFFFNQLELKNSLSAIGIDDKNFEMMAEKACGANGFINGWKKLYPKDVFNIYQASL
jgi:alcohol dehydrogenase YqhD (iron-dependent ADH family)